ncbi:hypothetical protein FRC17_009858 [Serendipita sp. 399]|nr:hypothetical protein FRC17_009858 [Serendipita sp. 399]
MVDRLTLRGSASAPSVTPGSVVAHDTSAPSMIPGGSPHSPLLTGGKKTPILRRRQLKTNLTEQKHLEEIERYRGDKESHDMNTARYARRAKNAAKEWEAETQKPQPNEVQLKKLRNEQDKNHFLMIESSERARASAAAMTFHRASRSVHSLGKEIGDWIPTDAQDFALRSHLKTIAEQHKAYHGHIDNAEDAAKAAAKII